MATLESHNFNGPESFTFSLTNQILDIWPNLKDTFHEVCLIYAGFHPDFSFFTRQTAGVTNQIIDEYMQGKRQFMFECFGEGVSEEVIVKIHRCIDGLTDAYPDMKFYYLTGVIDAESIYRSICERENLTPYIHIMSCDYFLKINSQSYPKYDIDYGIANREKNFVCLNKVHRQHRIELLELLLERKLINDNCYYSFHDPSLSSANTLVNLPVEHYPNIKANLSFIETLRLNFDNTRTNPIDVRQEDLKFFNNSYFSVVTETLYYDNNYAFPKVKCHVSDVQTGIFITEKTTKVLALKHPFILVSVPNMLRALRDLGYKTFHPFIDESYDTILDDDLRLEYVVNEIERLSKQSTAEWIEWTRNVKPIVEHNYNLFFSQKKHD